MNPRYPIFIVSKGRWDNMLTARALDEMSVPYQLIVEGSERDQYAECYQKFCVGFGEGGWLQAALGYG